MEQFYRRRLPHWQRDGDILFITFNLEGALPRSVREELCRAAARLRQLPGRAGENADQRLQREQKQLFAAADRVLGQLCHGAASGCGTETGADAASVPPGYCLRDPAVARIVRDSMRFYNGTRYREHRYCIMPNHVHWLIEPLPRDGGSGPVPAADQEAAGARCWPVGEILKNFKGYTSRFCNRPLGRRGTFWHDESFDHWTRDLAEFERIVGYIDRNPVSAGLCSRPEDWPWSSAGEAATDPTT